MCFSNPIWFFAYLFFNDDQINRCCLPHLALHHWKALPTNCNLHGSRWFGTVSDKLTSYKRSNIQTLFMILWNIWSQTPTTNKSEILLTELIKIVHFFLPVSKLERQDHKMWLGLQCPRWKWGFWRTEHST